MLALFGEAEEPSEGGTSLTEIKTFEGRTFP